MRFQRKACRSGQGYILIPAVILIAAIAAIALFNSQQSLTNLQLANTEFDNTQARFIAQAGMQHAIQQAGSQGCGPYTNLTNVALGNHSYSATLNTTQGTTDSFNITVDQDNWIQSDSPTANNGVIDPLKVNSQIGKDYRTLYRFDLASAAIPAGSTILSATARFYVVKAHPQGPVTIHRVTENWAEGTSNWNNMNKNMEAAVLATIPPQSVAGEWVSVNLTSQVQAWLNGQSNHGIMLRAPTEAVDAEYSSRDSTSYYPRLEIITGSLPAATSSISATSNLANGTSHSLTRERINLQQTPSFQRTFQPGAISTEDSWIDSSDLVTTHGSDNTLSLSDDSQRALLRFNLPNSLPYGAVVDSVSLQFYVNGVGSSGDVAAYGVQRDWVEGSVTWNSYDGTNNWDNAGGDADSEAIAQVNVVTANQWHSLDITDLARQWYSGERVNHGVLLRAQGASLTINSSDHSSSNTHPRLLLSYVCACGSNCLLPQGSGQIAMVYGESGGQLSPQDQIKKAYLEAWGYSVNTYEDNSLGTLNIANYNALFISNTVVAGNVGNQFTDDNIGIVTDEILLDADLAMATAAWTESGINIDIIENNHFITAPFAPGFLSIYGALVVLDEGAQQLGGGNAAGRRVMLPLGRNTETNFNWDYLDSNALLMVQRSLEWSKSLRCNDDDYRDNFQTVSFGNNDGSVNFINNWQELDGDGSGPDQGNVEIWQGKLYLDDKPNRDGPRMRRRFNLNGADAAILSFDFEMNQVDLGSDVATLDIKTDTGAWTQLVDFSQWSGSYSGSITEDISAFISPNSQIRLRITNGYSQGNEYIAFDNLRIGVCGTLIP